MNTGEPRKKFFMCYFESTRACNLNCRYCMTKNPRKPPRDHTTELSTDEIKRLVVDEVKKYCTHGAIAFSGGEHLLRKDALEILEYTAGAGLWSFINTSGSLLTADLVKRVKKVTGGKVIFVFSLNSILPDIQKWSRNDSLWTIIRSMLLCLKAGVDFFVITTVSRNNLKSLGATVKLLKLAGLPLLRSPFVMRGMGDSHRELALTPGDMKDVIHPILRNYYRSYVSYTPFFAGPEFLRAKWAEMNMELDQLGCQAARGFVGVSAEGNVAPCVHLLDNGLECGNVRDQPLTEILRHNPIINAVRSREDLKGKCGRCRYKQTCGGCRALAYYRTGDCLAEDPTCFFEPVDETTRSEHEEFQNRNVARFVKFIKTKNPWKSFF
ncbi:MAG: radical SAM protein [Elusimicrobia bacterium]|nr:radical SAM protein [Elusimicrobiota bacterium]